MRQRRRAGRRRRTRPAAIDAPTANTIDANVKMKNKPRSVNRCGSLQRADASIGVALLLRQSLGMHGVASNRATRSTLFGLQAALDVELVDARRLPGDDLLPRVRVDRDTARRSPLRRRRKSSASRPAPAAVRPGRTDVAS